MPTKNPLLEYIEAHNKTLVSHWISIILGVGVFLLGQLAVVFSAIYDREWLESVPIFVGILVCPTAVVLPIATAFVVGVTYETYAPKIDKVRELKFSNLSNHQLIQGLWRGTLVQIRPVPELTVALASVMATSLALQVDFWDTAAGSYAPPPPPLSSYTTMDYIANAVFWFGFHICLIALNGMSVFLSIWLCIRRKSATGSDMATFATSTVIVGLGLLFFWMALIIGYFVAWIIACVLPILIGSLVFYRAAKASLRRYRMY